MAIETPPTIAPPPENPSSDDIDNFDPEADAFLAWIVLFYSYLVALVANIVHNATEAYNYAGNAATSASTAAGYATAADAAATLAGATPWVSGEVFTSATTGPAVIGSARYSLINFQSFRRKTAGAGTVDPSLDPTNWDPTGGITPSGAQTLTNKIYQGEKQVSVALSGSVIDCNAGNVFTKTATGALTWTMSNVPPAGQAWGCVLKLRNGGLGTQTLPSGSIWAYGSVPTFSSSGLDMFGLMTEDGGSTWTWSVLGKAMA